MKLLYHILSIAAGIGSVILLVLLADSCHHDKGVVDGISGQAIQTVSEPTPIDLIDQAREVGSECAFAVIDSLEQTNAISTSMASFQRADLYHDLSQLRLAVIQYKKAIDTNELLYDDTLTYYRAIYNLSIVEQNLSDIDESLNHATNAYAEALADPSPKVQDYANMFLAHIGSCQMKLGRIDDAANTLNDAKKRSEQLAQDQKYAPYYVISCIEIACIAINQYLNLRMFDKAKPWVDMMGSWLTRLQESSYDAKTVAKFQAQYDVNLAAICNRMGQKERARQAYEHFLASEYAQTYGGIYDQAFYLELTEQWNDLLRIQLKIDSAERAEHVSITLDYLIESSATTFKAYMMTGHRDEALRMANEIIGMLDTVRVNQQRNDAAELATIYETQKKNAQIVQQQASLSRQHLIIIGIVSSFIIIALATFIFFRHRSALRLRAAHKQLQDAYTQVEQMNRQLEQKNQQLTYATERAEVASRMKTNFIHQISHEIRTPLNILSGFTQIVTTPDMELDNETRADINRQITENANRITSLVNKMLELSEANSCAVIEQADTVSAVQLATEAVEMSGIERASHVNFDLQLSWTIQKLKFNTNLQQAVRVIVLLLDNAIKFTHPANGSQPAKGAVGKIPEQGKVCLRVNYTAMPNRQELGSEGSHSSLVFIVEDNGIGVPANEAEHIFDEFVQLDEYYEGTGIGLTLARSIARRLGGDVVLDTLYKDGARFIFTLPVHNS